MGEEALDPEAHQTETAKDLVLLQLSTMTILLHLDSVLMLDMVLQVVLTTVMEPLVVQTLGMEHLRKLVQGTLVLVRLMLVFNHPEAEQERGRGKDLESRYLLAQNYLNHTILGYLKREY